MDSIHIFQGLTEDYALFLTVLDTGIVAIGSRFGSIGLLLFPIDAAVWQHSLPTSLIHSAPHCIDLLKEKDKRGNTIMPHGNERLVSLDLSVLPRDWPVPIENTLRQKFQVTLWVGIENSQGNIDDTTQGCTRVAAVSFPDPYFRPNTDLGTAFLSSSAVPLLHWYDGNLPNRSTPTPASKPQGPAFLSLIESAEYPQRRVFYCYGTTAAKCRQEKGTQNSNKDSSYDLLHYNDLQRLQLECQADSEIISSWYWELENNLPGKAADCLVLATSAGKLYRVSMAYLKNMNEKELEKAVCQVTFGLDRKHIGWDDVETILPVSLHACGKVVGIYDIYIYAFKSIFDCVS